MVLLTMRINVPMNSLRNSRTVCRSRNRAIVFEERSKILAARAAAIDDRDDPTDDVDAVVAISLSGLRFDQNIRLLLVVNVVVVAALSCFLFCLRQAAKNREAKDQITPLFTVNHSFCSLDETLTKTSAHSNDQSRNEQ